MIKLFPLTLILILAWSCIQDANNVGGAQCRDNYIYNPTSRSCDTAINGVVDPTLESITISEDSPAGLVSLTYSDTEGDLAISCSILAYSDGIDDYTTACSCNGSGVCSTYIAPDPDYNGTAQFSYNIVDQDGTSSTKVVYVVVASVNDAPVATNASYSTDELTVYSGDLSSIASDSDLGDNLTYSIAIQSTNGVAGSLDSSAGTFVFTPYDDDVLHSDDVAAMTYQACDSSSACAQGVVTFTVTDVNNAPVASTSQIVTILEGVTTAFDITSAFDMESDTLTYAIQTSPTEGTLTGLCLTGGTSCSYNPTDDDYSGSDSFTYQVCDDQGDCSAVVTVTIYITAVNDAPTVGADQAVAVTEDTDAIFTLNPASDPESGGTDSSYGLTYTVVTSPTYGTLSGCVLASSVGGSCTYTPSNNYDGTSGSDTFTYKVNDGLADSATFATVTLNFTAVDDIPTVDSISRMIVGEGSSNTSDGLDQSDGFLVDEGGGTYENDQEITITILSSNTAIVAVADVAIYYDLDDDAVLADATELLGTGAAAVDLSATTFDDTTDSINTHKFYLKVTSTAGTAGTTTITVRANDGTTDTDMTFDVYVPEITSVHAGWKHISAIGKKVDKDDVELTSTSAVSLEWHDFSLSGTGEATGVTIDGWNIYRREYNGSYDFTSPLNGSTPIASTILYYTDSTVSANQVYFYKVFPVDSYYGFDIPTYEPHDEIRILSPPDNMAFVHRWMVNQEVCGLMNMTITTSEIDMTNNFRCNYVGPGDDIDRDGTSDGYYDIGSDMLVDISEAGCPYTPASTAAECGVNGCIGIGDPTVANPIVPTVADLVYYDREDGKCYQSTAALAWEEFNGAAAYAATVAINAQKALLPPLVQVSQTSAYNICDARNDIDSAGIAGINVNLVYNLPRRKEQIGYSSWNYLTSTGIEHSEIRELENGVEIDNNSKCNSASASGLTVGYTSVDMPASPFSYSVTGTDYSGIRSIYTGSIAAGGNALTPDCISRYGIQDLHGNVAEWLLDRVTCTAATPFTCTGTTMVDTGATISDFTVSDAQFGAYILDGVRGPCVNASTCDSALDGWYFDDDSNNNQAGRITVPLALPIATSFESSYATSAVVPYIFPIGNNFGLTDEQLHDDYFDVNAASIGAGTGGMSAGGSYLSGDKAGRYTVEFQPTATTDPSIGFRCVAPVNSTDYNNDASHTYSY